MKRHRFLFFFLVFISTCIQLVAQPLIRLRDADGMRMITMETGFLVDSSAALTIDQVSSPAMASRFQLLKVPIGNFGINANAVWMKFVCTTGENDSWYLRESGALVSDYCLYYKENGNWIKTCRGYNHHPDSQAVKIATLSLPLKLKAGDTAVFFIRAASILPKLVDMKIGSSRAMIEAEHRSSTAGGIYLGIIIIMILYNLFLFISNRDPGYIYYALYVFFCGVFILLNNGFARHFPWFMQQIHEKCDSFFPVMFGLFGLLFTANFLDLRRNQPRLEKALYFFYAAVCVAIVISYVWPYAGTQFIQLLGLLLSLYCLLVGFRAWRAGYSPALYYLFGFGAYMLSLITYIVLAILGRSIQGFDPQSILMTGSALEAIILSFAIGDKLNNALRGQQRAQEEALASARENEKLVREQNMVLEQRVNERTAEISQQKAIIEEKNKDILSSINYARKIQTALLASEEMLTQNLPEYFILYRPKDIVSGDFYWAGNTPSGHFMLLCGDCTGHGVPGAFMSLLGVSFLNEITIERKVTRPDEVLNQLREEVIRALGTGGEAMRDGMDAVFCRFNFSSKQMQYACANNPIWRVRNGQLEEFGPDKQPIGAHAGEQKPFQLGEMDLEKDDLIYLFTDGFADQFGGPRGKKFKYKQLQQKITEIHRMPLREQQRELEKVLDDWQGGLEQVDDILIIGVNVK